MIEAVEIGKAYRLLNLGATPLVSSSCNGVEDIMPAAWVCALDLEPTKVSAVIAKDHFTRMLIEKRGMFVLNIPVVGQADLVMKLGSVSKNDDPDKLEKADVKTFKMPGFDIPLVQGCAAWLICEVISEPHNEGTYDLFVARCVAAWSDTRAFKDGHWQFEKNPDFRTLHYVAGGHFYAIGEPVHVPGYDES